MESITTNGLTRASSRNEERWTRLRATNTREPALSSHSRVGIRKKAAGWLEALSGTNATSEPIASTPTTRPRLSNPFGCARPNPVNQTMNGKMT